MGQTLTSGSNVKVLLDEPVFRPGKQLTGRVMVNIDAEIPKKEQDQVVLRVRGEESVEWRSKRRKKNLKKHNKANNTFWDQTFQITHGWTDKYPVGQFEIPFQVLIPEFCTCFPSFARKLSSGHAGIYYTVTAIIKGSGQMFSNDIQSTGSFQVVVPVPEIRPEQVAKEKTVSSNNCFNPIHLTARAYLATNLYCGGQIVPLQINIENLKRSSISKMYGVLQYVVEYSNTQGGTEYTSFDLEHIKLNPVGSVEQHVMNLNFHIPSVGDKLMFEAQHIRTYFQIIFKILDPKVDLFIPLVIHAHPERQVKPLQVAAVQPEKAIPEELGLGFGEADHGEIVPSAPGYDEGAAPVPSAYVEKLEYPDDWNPRKLETVRSTEQFFNQPGFAHFEADRKRKATSEWLIEQPEGQ